MIWLEQLLQLKVIRPIDAEFGRFIAGQEGAGLPIDPALVLLVVMVSAELGNQNVCLDLSKINPHDPLNLGPHRNTVPLPDITVALNRLEHYHCISLGTANDLDPLTPLITHANHLYLQRYWYYEVSLSHALKRKLAHDSTFELAEAQQLLARLFPTVLAVGDIDWQKMACATALIKSFSVITGGPGTGKTTTVTKLLALICLLHHQAQRDQKPIIKLVTPTGKAAARLSESIKGAKQRLPITDAEKALIPDDASTIHRLLGVKPHSSEFIHHQDNKLHIDVLVVDEVSMVDLPMMAKLFAALPLHTKVVLLGDKDQLASVEAGSVLADICAGVSVGIGRKLRYNTNLMAQIEQLTQMEMSAHCDAVPEITLRDCICELKTSHRFKDKSGIGQLAKAVNRSDWQGVKYLMAKTDAALIFNGISDANYLQLIHKSAIAYQPYLQMIVDGESPQAIIEQFNRFQLLCALREGQYGVSGLNQAIEAQLKRLELINNSQLYYPGKPIMISQNDYSLQLFNGDVGLILADQSSGHLKAWFITPDNKVKSVYPNRLPSHDSVYAMTVHKSQGSEFEQVAMILPPLAQVLSNKVISKELIYTGITRAKSHFCLYAEPKVLEIAIGQKTQRASGLGGLLYEDEK